MENLVVIDALEDVGSNYRRIRKLHPGEEVEVPLDEEDSDILRAYREDHGSDE